MRISKVWKKLVNDGPQTLDELPTEKIGYKDKTKGVAKFNPSSSYRGQTVKGTGHTLTVVYIEDKHTPEEVVEKWRETNYERIQRVPKRAIHHRVADYGEEFKKVSYKIFDPYEDYTNGGAYKDYRNQECKLCGETYSGQMVNHLQECENR